jgi:PIN domain nuclease of toxin-antitoxin system
MRILLDTNALLWYFSGNERMLSVAELVGSFDSEVFISTVSWWEIAIKTSIGKLTADIEKLQKTAATHGFLELPLSSRHASALKDLPPIHNDPFDRMLIAQALTEPMRFISGDNELQKYSSLVITV